MIEILNEVKSLRQVKSYSAPIPENLVKKVHDYLIAFVGEETPIGIQNILSVSRLDGKKFSLSDLEADIPELFSIFPLKVPYPFERNVAGRGYMHLFVVED